MTDDALPTAAPGAAAGTTVGVALPIPEPWGGHLQRLRESYGDRRARTIPTHVTLMPPTPVAQGQAEELREHLRKVASEHRPFTVILRGTGTFRPVSDVVYVQLAQGVSSCERLQSAVRSGPVARDLVYPYHPHVTLAHDVSAGQLDRAFADLAGFTCTFTADVFRLYVHHGDEVWRTVEDFHLGD